MTKHTPGPWKVIQSDSPVVQTEDDHHAICTTYGVYATREQKEANANLIAAAPDMLECLQATIDYLGFFATKEANELWGKAAMVIRKAHGEETK